jgi:hypothetical protein
MTQHAWDAEAVQRALRKHEGPLTEFEELVWDILPAELKTHFVENYAPPKYIALTGGDRICALCGAEIHEGSRRHHSLYHRQLTLTIWALQGLSLSRAVRLDDAGAITEVVTEKPKKRKKGKK